MAGKPQIDWPSDDDLLALGAECRSLVEMAGRLGVSDGGLKHHLGRRGLRERVGEGFRRTLRVAEAPPVDDPQRIRLAQVEAEAKALRKENRDYEEALADQQKFFDRIVEATQVPVRVPKFKVASRPGSLPARSVVCPIYDQQFGQLVRPEDTPSGRGAFSTAIFDRRLARYVEGVTGTLRDYAQSHRIQELIIPFGGDQVEGDEIFAGQAWQLELDPIEQCWQLAAKMDEAVQSIIAFAKTELGVPRVAIYGVPGNHGKVGGRKSGARPKSYSWDVLFLRLLKDRLRAHPVDQFEINPAGSLLFAAAEFVFLMVHGDQIRGWGGLPFYGLTKFDGRAMRLHRVLYDYLLLGHHHQPGEIPNGSGEHIVSGDWVGANNLSGEMTAASRPQQKILFVARKWGITETAKIYFTDADEAHAPAIIHGQAA